MARVLVTGMSGTGKSTALCSLAGRGKTTEEWAEVLRNLAEVEPLLRAGATVEIDAAAPVSDVVRRLEALAH
jgi:predicted ATPase